MTWCIDVWRGEGSSYHQNILPIRKIKSRVYKYNYLFFFSYLPMIAEFNWRRRNKWMFYYSMSCVCKREKMMDGWIHEERERSEPEGLRLICTKEQPGEGMWGPPLHPIQELCRWWVVRGSRLATHRCYPYGERDTWDLLSLCWSGYISPNLAICYGSHMWEKNSFTFINI